MNRFLIITIASLSLVAEGATVERVFRPARVTRGNTNVSKVQPIDDAAWVWVKGDFVETKSMTGESARPEVKDKPARIARFRKTFKAVKGEKLTIDVSADERYYLTLDGKFVSRGPNRGDVQNWQYNTYDVELEEGEHVFEATVWAFGKGAPLAQLSLRPGFIFKASGSYDKELTTGKAAWQAAMIDNLKLQPMTAGVFGTGGQHEMFGAGPTFAQPKSWGETEIVRNPVDAGGFSQYGIRTDGWLLFPSQLPDQLERPIKAGEFVAAAKTESCMQQHVYVESDLKDPLVAQLNALIKDGKSVTIPAKTRVQAMCNLGNYVCAFPVVGLKGGKDAFFAIGFTETPRNGKTGRKASRNEIVGCWFDGYGDWYRPDGGEGTYVPPHFRCGKWVRFDIETKDEPLVIPDPPPYAEKVSFQKADVKAAQDLPFVRDDVLELDFRLLPGVMTKEARPRCVYGLKAVDPKTGAIVIDSRVSIHPEAGLRGMWESMPGQVLKALVRYGKVPGEVKTCSGRVFRLLRPLCLELPFKLSLHDTLPAFVVRF